MVGGVERYQSWSIRIVDMPEIVEAYAMNKEATAKGLDVSIVGVKRGQGVRNGAHSGSLIRDILQLGLPRGVKDE